MATDGTKIIDGDTAHDTYWGIMDLYDNGVALELILEEFPLNQNDYYDDFENEIYVTSCGLAYWEIGLMNVQRLAFIKRIISKDACVKEWSEESLKDGKSRETVLKKYISKIEAPNQKLRLRKKFRKISNFIFDENSVLTFKLSNENYGITICAKIEQSRGECVYWLIPTTFISELKPTLESIMDSDILGRTISNFYPKQEVIDMQPGIEKIWTFLGGTPNFMFGYVINAIEHKNLFLIKDNFEKIGKLNLIDGLKKMGSMSAFSSFQQYDDFHSNLEENITNFQSKKFPITSIIN